MTTRETDPAALKKKAWLLALLILSLIGLGLAWRSTSLGEWLDIQQLVGLLREQGGSLGLLAAVAWVSFASVVAIPLAVIILVSAIAFGPWLGLLYSLTGACLGAVLSYGIGSYLGHDALCRLAGERVNRLSEQLARKGILAIIAIRMMPIAPFAIVNMIAGTTHISLRDFIIGTCLGMLPGALAIALLGNHIAELISSSQGVWVVIIAASAMVLIGWAVIKIWLGRKH